MKRTTMLIGGVATAALVVAGAVAATTATDDDTPITGDAYDRATGAALEHVGGGTVTDTEAGDEDGAYEVEITRPDGSRIDVHLDTGFRVLGTEEDGSGEDDTD